MKTQTSPQHPSYKKNIASKNNIKKLVLNYFVLFFLLLLFILLGISLPIYIQYEKGLKEQLLAQEEISVVSAKQMIQKEMYEQLHILDMLVKSSILNTYLNNGTPEEHQRLEDFFKTSQPLFTVLIKYAC